MPFTLKVQFTGLCLHLFDESRQEVAVLMPDARRVRTTPDFHHDRTEAVRHVGYLRVDLASIALADKKAKIPPAGKRTDPDLRETGPFFEVVYRFARQTLDFGLSPSATPIVFETGLPKVNEIVPTARRLGDLFTGNPGPQLGFRTLLQGGELKPLDPGVPLEKWSVTRRLNGAKRTPILGQFPGEVLWTREVKDASELTLTITNFDGTHPIVLPLRPDAKGEIAIKIANLCADNPLEWDELMIREVIGEDSDFKWIYQLFEPEGESWKELLDDLVLPAPRLETGPAGLRGTGAGNCVGGEATEAFPPFDQWTSP